MEDFFTEAYLYTALASFLVAFLIMLVFVWRRRFKSEVQQGSIDGMAE